jgi:hypothetical protein
MTCFELAMFGFFIVAGATAGCLIAGSIDPRYEWIGLLLGIVTGLLFLVGIGWVMGIDNRKLEDLPLCANGKCKGGSGYEFVRFTEEYAQIYKCHCGDEYIKKRNAYLHFARLLRDGTEGSPIYKFRSFRGWKRINGRVPPGEAEGVRSHIG